MVLLFRKIILLLLPLIVMLAVYLAFDPFEVVYSYRSHYNDTMINYNWDYNQTETLLRNYSVRRYDSFIFGNSRSSAFITRDWRRFADSSGMLHFAAMNESLYGIHRKVLLLSKEHMPVRNALVILDTQVLSATVNSTGHLFIKHPKVSGENSLVFHLTFFREFMDIPFFIGYLDYKLTGKVRPLFRSRFSERITYDPVTGDKNLVDREKMIEESPERYYDDKRSVFYPRDLSKEQYSSPVIKEIQIRYLQDIKNVFTENRTDYRIVISPLYDMKRLHPADLATLKEIFGSSRVFDYSGNNCFTRDVHNYYDGSHFRPRVGREIMGQIYMPSRVISSK